MSCRVVSYHIIYHIISYHIISYHTSSYHIISYHTYHIISYHIISYHISSMNHNTIIYYIISGRFISYVMSCHIRHIVVYENPVSPRKRLQTRSSRNTTLETATQTVHIHDIELSRGSLPWAGSVFLSGVPDLFDRNKILSGGDLSHYQVPHCIRVLFYLFDLCLFITIFNFILNYVPIVTFWIFTYHKI